jgi:hypothetical protein
LIKRIEVQIVVVVTILVVVSCTSGVTNFTHYESKLRTASATACVGR